MIDDSRPSWFGGFVYPALLLAGIILIVALALSPLAIGRSDSAGPGGLAVAAAICLAAGCLAEGFVWLSRHRLEPVSAMLIGTFIRMLPPLAFCLFLAASGQTGREHLAFIGYLLTFYLVTLAVETILAVKRTACCSSKLSRSAR
jgi:hypothetical protein